MLIYWIVGLIVGWRLDYESKLFSLVPPATQAEYFYYIGSFVLTLVIQNYINIRFSSYGRSRDYFGITCFAIGNGLSETMLFLASYDCGRHGFLVRTLGLSPWQASCLGFLAYFCYNGFIHAFFWAKCVFPEHVHPKAPPFHQHGLPALMALSVIWLTLYEKYESIAFVCFLHVLVDFCAAYTIAYPSLSSTLTLKKPHRERVDQTEQQEQ